MTDGAPRPLEEVVAHWQRNHQRQLDIDGRAIRYVDAGTGPTVLLIHGLGLSWHVWAANLTDLVRDHRVIAVDLPGFGGSDPRPWGDRDLAPYADDLATLLDRVEAGPPTVVGHSLGGVVAQWLALRLGSGCHGLLLAASAGMKLSRVRFESLIATVTALRTLFYSPRVADGLLRIPALRQAILGGLVVNRDALSEKFLRLMLAGYAAPGHWRTICAARGDRVHQRIGELGVPTTLVVGGSDRLITPALTRRLAATIPGAAYYEWPDVGHGPQVERPTEFADLVRGLAGRTSPS